MPDVNIKYNGSTISFLNTTGAKTVKTGGKFAQHDIIIEYTKPSPSLTTAYLTENGAYTPDGFDGYSSVIVNVSSSGEPVLQNKTVTPTTSSQSITADSDYDGLSTVTVNAIPSNYVDTSDANATSGTMRYGYSGYVNGVKVNGSIQTYEGEIS